MHFNLSMFMCKNSSWMSMSKLMHLIKSVVSEVITTLSLIQLMRDRGDVWENALKYTQGTV